MKKLNANLLDILEDCEKKALVSLDGAVDFTLKDKVRDGRLYVEQGIIAGCAGGGFENICAAADILENASIGPDAFTLSIYPASMPIYMELVKNGCAAKLLQTGAVLKTAFCGPLLWCGRHGRQTMHSPFATRPETFRIARDRSSRAGRLHLWH